MLRWLPIVLALPVLLAYGVTEGLWTDRWGPSPELQQSVPRLAQVPAEVGPWESIDDPLEARHVAKAELHAHLRRRYVNRQTGEELTVLLVCGRPGPIAAHSPEVCFGGAGFDLAERRAVPVAGVAGRADFWAGRFDKTAGVPESLQVYWAWNTGDGWQAVTDPRWSFAGRRALYKLYVVRPMTRPDEPAEKGPIPGFLGVFLPEVNRCLFPGA
jgi:hypothetical protein